MFVRTAVALIGGRAGITFSHAMGLGNGIGVSSDRVGTKIAMEYRAMDCLRMCVIGMVHVSTSAGPISTKKSARKENARVAKKWGLTR
jgi:hypothetical protein